MLRHGRADVSSGKLSTNTRLLAEWPHHRRGPVRVMQAVSSLCMQATISEPDDACDSDSHLGRTGGLPPQAALPRAQHLLSVFAYLDPAVLEPPRPGAGPSLPRQRRRRGRWAGGGPATRRADSRPSLEHPHPPPPLGPARVDPQRART